MDQKPIQETASRRKVLKAAGAGFIPVTRFGSTENLDTSPGKSLNGKRVFTGQGVSITLPEKAERARSRKRADVAIIRDDTTLSRGERRNLIRDGTPTFITGGTAEESLVSVLYDIDKESVSKEGVGTNETGLELSHGIEFEPNRPSYQSALVPDESRGVLNTYFFGNTTLSSGQGREGSKYVSDVDVLRNIDEVIGKEEQKGNVVAGEPRSSFVSSLPTESPDEDSTCPDGWACLGETQRKTDVYYSNSCYTVKYGSIFKEVRGGYIEDENDSDTDYWGWKLLHKISNDSSNYFFNDNMERDFDTEPDRTVRKAGPSNTNETESTTISLGIEAGDTGSSVGVKWQWGSTEKEVSTEQDFFDTFTGVNHLWEISGDATDQSVTGEPGYQVETAEGAGSVGYDYESVWRWYHSRYASTRKKSKTGRRTGSGRS